MSVLIVGNAPVKEKLGEKVDEFDVVVRVNNFSGEYVEYVGIKLDIWAVGVPNLQAPNNYCKILPAYPYHNFRELSARAREQYGAHRMIGVDSTCVKILQEKVGFFHPDVFTTTGLTAIELLLYLYEERPIYTLGFEFTTPDENRYMWGPLVQKEETLLCHDPELDKRYYNLLLEGGGIKELS